MSFSRVTQVRPHCQKSHSILSLGLTRTKNILFPFVLLLACVFRFCREFGSGCGSVTTGSSGDLVHFHNGFIFLFALHLFLSSLNLTLSRHDKRSRHRCLRCSNGWLLPTSRPTSDYGNCFSAYVCSILWLCLAFASIGPCLDGFGFYDLFVFTARLFFILLQRPSTGARKSHRAVSPNHSHPHPGPGPSVSRDKHHNYVAPARPRFERQIRNQERQEREENKQRNKSSRSPRGGKRGDGTRRTGPKGRSTRPTVAGLKARIAETLVRRYICGGIYGGRIW